MITREQFELAARIKKVQDEILWWEREDRHYPPEDPERRERFKRARDISAKFRMEDLTELVPRGMEVQIF